MEFSYVDGRRRKPEPRLKGVCNLCGSETISKCGNIRIHHWAHWHRRNCDPWWENETQWHRDWKSEFPEHCREVVVISNDGEAHRADVKTECGRVVEFQHSAIGSAVRRVRETFYKDMAWVVDGLGFRDSFDTQLLQAQVLENTPIRLRLPTGYCSILKAWADSAVSVYVDFGDETLTDKRFNFSKPVLWRLCPINSRSHVDLIPIWREVFIHTAQNGGSINGIHAPEMTVVRAAKVLGVPATYQRPEPVVQKYQRRPAESDLEYALRVWNFDRLE